MYNGIVIAEFEATGDNDRDMEIAKGIIDAQGLTKEVSVEQAMFRHAVSFAATAADLHKKNFLRPPADPKSIIPFVVNSAFSVEIYLKTLHKLDGCVAHGHDLLELYDRLTDNTRDSVLTHAQRVAPEWGVEPPPSQAQLRDYVGEIRRNFETWRYLYEDPGRRETVRIPELIVVLAALHAVCQERGLG